MQLSPSVLEELVQKHYVENKKIVSLEGNLLRLAMDQKIPRNECPFIDIPLHTVIKIRYNYDKFDIDFINL